MINTPVLSIVCFGSKTLQCAVILFCSLTSFSAVSSITQEVDRPNILLIVADDLGYSDIGAFGSEIETPNLNALADEGVRFSNFHVLPSCSPTRAVMLTGVDNHIAGIGAQLITEQQQGKPGYKGRLSLKVKTIAELLRDANFRTYMAGKWHLGEALKHGPSQRGFSRSFALIPGGGSHHTKTFPLHPKEPIIYRRDGHRINKLPADFYSTRSYTDELLTWLDRDKDSEQPFFAYLAYTAPHDPLHAPGDYVKKYKNHYTEGFENLRKKRFEGMKLEGITPHVQKLPPWPDRIQKWDSLSDTTKEKKAKDMAIYAAMIDYMDGQIGRVLRWLRDNDQFDNTVIIFISDNGANGIPAHIGYTGHTEQYSAQFDNSLDNRGEPNSFVDLGPGWATAVSGSFDLFKGFASEGGVSAPAIIRIPKNPRPGLVDDSFMHIQDFMPTFLELAGVSVDGVSEFQSSFMEGRSLLSNLTEGNAMAVPDQGIAYELHGNRAFYHGRYKILQTPLPFGTGRWRLYDLAQDRSEQFDLALEKPPVLEKMVVLHQAYERDKGVIYSLPSALKNIAMLHAVALVSVIAAIGVLLLSALKNSDSVLPRLVYITVYTGVMGLFTLAYWQTAIQLALAALVINLVDDIKTKSWSWRWALYALGVIMSVLLLMMETGWVMAFVFKELA